MSEPKQKGIMSMLKKDMEKEAINLGIEQIYTKGKLTGKFNHPKDVEEQIEIMRQNREEIPVLREKISAKLKREKEVAEAELQLSKDFVAMAEHPDQHPKLKQILLRISELNNVLASNRFNMHAQISIINEEWKKWETMALKEIRWRQDQLNHCWCEIKFWKKRGDHAKTNECESRYKVLTSEFVQLIHDIRKKKEEDIATWLLATIQFELEFYSSTAPQIATVESSVRAMGPVQAIEHAGLEKFSPQFMLTGAGPAPEAALPALQYHQQPQQAQQPLSSTSNPGNPFSNLQIPVQQPVQPVGITPRSSRVLPSPAVKKARALYDFAPQEGGELGFANGEELFITQDIGGGWLRAKNQAGSEGLIPGNYVQMLD